MSDRLLVWRGLEEWRAEVATASVTGDRLHARGTQIGVDPLPYRLDYALHTGPAFVTELLELRASGTGWERSLRLTRDEAGAWRCAVAEEGASALPPPGGSSDALAGALDCDLGLSPLANAMPVLRHHLHREPGAHDLLMAWVSVPDLGLHASRQRYEHLAPGRVLFSAREPEFSAELELDPDGFVVSYPGLAERVT